MPEIFSAGGSWPLLLLLALQVGEVASAAQPWHCAPCSAERLALCPPVPSSCPELSRPAGCGCCPVCALPLGAACGVATARCARGLTCRALPGEPRPLHALTRGQGACVPEPATAALGTESSTEEEGTVASAPTLFSGAQGRPEVPKPPASGDRNARVLERGGERSFSLPGEASHCWVLVGEAPGAGRGPRDTA